MRNHGISRLVLFFLLTLGSVIGWSTPTPTPALPVGYWPLDGNGTDASGNGHTATLTGSYPPVQSGDAVMGTSLSFGYGGCSTYCGHVQVGSFSNDGVMTYGPNNDFTWACWFKRGTGTIAFEVLMSRRRWMSDSDQYGMHILYYPDGIVWISMTQGNSTAGTSFASHSTCMNDGSWHHVALVRDTVAKEFRLYIDGNLDNQAIDDGPDMSLPGSFRLGEEGQTLGGSRQFHGLIDEVYVYDRALAIDEIGSLVGAPKPTCVKPSYTPTPTRTPTASPTATVTRTPTPIGTATPTPLMEIPVGYWPLNGNGTDSSGNGHAGTLQGSFAPVQSTDAVLGTSLSFGYGGCSTSCGYVQVGSYSNDGVMTYGPNNDFTWACWFRAKSGTLFEEVLMSRRRWQSDSDQYGMHITYYPDGRVRVSMVQGNGTKGPAFYSNANYMNDGCWHHLAVVRDTTAMEFRLYVDGSYDNQGSDDGPDMSLAGSFRLGEEGQTLGGSRQFHGLLDEAYVFDKALSAAQILNLASIPKPTCSTPTATLTQAPTVSPTRTPTATITQTPTVAPTQTPTPFCAGFAHDYSSDPGYDNSSSPSDYYWNSAAGTYHFYAEDSPDDYVYRPVTYGGGDFSLQVDFNLSECTWSGGLTMGLLSDDMRYDNDCIVLAVGNDDHGHLMGLNVNGRWDDGVVSRYDYSLGVWYSATIYYWASLNQASLEVRERDSGNLVVHIPVSGIASGQWTRWGITTAGGDGNGRAVGEIDNLSFTCGANTPTPTPTATPTGGPTSPCTGFAHDYSTNPGYDNSSSPSDYYWNSAAGTYHFYAQDSPDDYVFRPMAYAGEDFTLQVDFNLSECTWSGGLTMGLLSDDMRYDNDCIVLAVGNDDHGHLMGLNVNGRWDDGVVSRYDYSLGVWYSATIYYWASLNQASLEVRERDSGNLVVHIPVSGIVSSQWTRWGITTAGGDGNGRAVGEIDNLSFTCGANTPTPTPTATPPLSCDSGSSLVTLLEQRFEIWPPTGWTIEENGGDCWWWKGNNIQPSVGNLTGGSGNWAVADSDHCGSGYFMDTSLVSPSMDFSGLTKAELEFKSDMRWWSGGANESFVVDLSTDSGNSWNSILHREAANYRGPETIQLDLAAALGKPNVKIRFHYGPAEYEWWWQIDDIYVRGCSVSAGTATPTTTPTRTSTRTPTPIDTASPTSTQTRTPTWTPTGSPSATPTRKPTRTPTATSTRKPSSTPTSMYTRTPTATPTVCVLGMPLSTVEAPAWVHGLVHDGANLYMLGMDDASGKYGIYGLDSQGEELSSFPLPDAIPVEVDGQDVDHAGLAWDGRYFYVGTDSTDCTGSLIPTIWKLLPDTAIVDEKPVAVGRIIDCFPAPLGNVVQGLVWDGNFLWASVSLYKSAGVGTPGRIYKFSQTGSVVDSWDLTFDQPGAIAFDGGCLFCYDEGSGIPRIHRLSTAGTELEAFNAPQISFGRCLGLTWDPTSLSLWQAKTSSKTLNRLAICSIVSTVTPTMSPTMTPTKTSTSIFPGTPTRTPTRTATTSHQETPTPTASMTSQPTATLTSTPTPGGFLEGDRPVFVNPNDGDRVCGSKMNVHVNPPDNCDCKEDLSVRFEYRAESGTWLPIDDSIDGHTDGTGLDSRWPFFAHWNTSELPDGAYELRATGIHRDYGQDLSPATVTVERVASRTESTEYGGLDGQGQHLVDREVLKACLEEVRTGPIDENTVTNLILRSDSLTTDTRVQVTIEDLDSSANSARLGADYEACEIRDILLENGQSQLAPDKPAYVEILYEDVDSDGYVDGTSIREEDLRLYWWDTVNGRWRQYTADSDQWALDTNNNIAKVHPSHFSSSGLLRVKAGLADTGWLRMRRFRGSRWSWPSYGAKDFLKSDSTEAELRPMAGMELYGNKIKGGIAGLAGTGSAASPTYFGHFACSNRWYTGLALANPSAVFTCEVAMNAWSDEGKWLKTKKNIIIPPEGRMTGLVDTLFKGITGTGWIDVASNRPLLGLEIYGDKLNGGIAALPAETPSKELYLSHFASNRTWWTGISVTNPNGSEAALDMTAYDPLGNVLSAKSLIVPKRGKLSGVVSDPNVLGVAGTGSVRIVSDQPVIGLLVFGQQGTTTAKTDFASLPAQTPSTVATFPCYLNIEGWQTSIAVVNPSDEEIVVHLSILAADGSVLHEIDVPLGSHQKYSGMLNTLFDLTGYDQGAILLESEKPFCAFELFFCDLGDGKNYGIAGVEPSLQDVEVSLPHYASNAEWWTGFAAWNPDTTDSQGVIQALAEDGSYQEAILLETTGRGNLVKYIDRAFTKIGKSNRTSLYPGFESELPLIDIDEFKKSDAFAPYRND